LLNLNISFYKNSPKTKGIKAVTHDHNNTSLHTSSIITQQPIENLVLAKKLIITEEEKYGDIPFEPLPAQILRKVFKFFLNLTKMSMKSKEILKYTFSIFPIQNVTVNL